MRTVAAALALAMGLALLGCEGMNEFLNPSPTTQGSRVSEKLREIPPPAPDQVKTVTVYQFENKTGWPKGLAISNGMTDQFITALIKTGYFQVANRADLSQIMTERSLQQSGQATSEVGSTKLAGASLIFAGAVTELDEKGGIGLGIGGHSGHIGAEMVRAQVGIDVRVTDVATGLVIDSIDVRREVRKTGMSAGGYGVHGEVEMSNAMDLAIRETIEEAVYQIVMKYGVK
jgi:curli biogenesis system outer membrane secretion channel CsgG